MFSVFDEFSQLRKCIVHTGENGIDISWEDWERLVSKEDFKKHPESAPVTKQKLVAQVASLHNFLKKRGIEVVLAKTIDNAVAQVFTRDPGFVIGNSFYISSLRDSYRVDEIKGMENVLPKENAIDLRGKSVIIEGGDIVILSPSSILIGTGQTTNDLGYSRLEIELESSSFQTIHKIKHKALHLDCCLSPLPNGEALVAKHLIYPDDLKILEAIFNKLIFLDTKEADIHLASNIFWINEAEVISNRMTPKTNKILESLGYKVHKFDISELVKLWGGARCAIFPLERLS